MNHGTDSLYIKLDPGNISHSVELSNDVTLDVDQDNRVIGIDIQNLSSQEEEHRNEIRPGQYLKLMDPGHEDRLQSRLENANQHFRRMAAGVLNDQEALRLLAQLQQEGAGLAYITDAGVKFTGSIAGDREQREE